MKEPVALDYAFLAMAYAYLGRTGDAEAAAANAKSWIHMDRKTPSHRYRQCGKAGRVVRRWRTQGRPAGCVPADTLKEMVAPNLSRVKSCDQQRGR